MDIDIGDTLCSPDEVHQLPPITLAEPTVSIELTINSSPLVGRDGKHVTMNKVRDRLYKERRANISLKIEDIPGRDDAIRVCGRGELHLAVLIETMRREGFELSFSKPRVITKTVDDAVLEPMERVHVEVPEQYSGMVIEDLSRRKGEMRSLTTSEHGLTTQLSRSDPWVNGVSKRFSDTNIGARRVNVDLRILCPLERGYRRALARRHGLQ